jgi:hypothetical protein
MRKQERKAVDDAVTPGEKRVSPVLLRPHGALAMFFKEFEALWMG